MRPNVRGFRMLQKTAANVNGKYVWTQSMYNCIYRTTYVLCMWRNTDMAYVCAYVFFLFLFSFYSWNSLQINCNIHRAWVFFSISLCSIVKCAGTKPPTTSDDLDSTLAIHKTNFVIFYTYYVVLYRVIISLYWEFCVRRPEWVEKPLKLGRMGRETVETCNTEI